MSRKVKYSWWSAKRNPTMIHDFYEKKIIEAKRLVDINVHHVNEIELNLEVTNVRGYRKDIHKNKYTSATFDANDFVVKDFIRFKIKEVSEIDVFWGGGDKVLKGYEVLLNAINSHKYKVEAYNKSVIYLQELEEEFSKFKKRYL